MIAQENRVNYDYRGEEIEVCLQRRTERMKTTLENRVN